MLDHTKATEDDYEALANRLRVLAYDAGWMWPSNQNLIDNLMDAAMAIDELKFRLQSKKVGREVGTEMYREMVEDKMARKAREDGSV